MKSTIGILVALCLFAAPESAFSKSGRKFEHGLNSRAAAELVDAGVNKYTGDFSPLVSQDIGDGWTKHTFDPAAGDGPICIAGTPYSVFTKAGDPHKLMIFLQGGGACWQDFYNCNVLSEAQEPPPDVAMGIWSDKFRDGKHTAVNPVKNWSVVYLPYCDGSVFSGDNAVFDPAFGAAIGAPQAIVRFHRGLRNATAGIDVAKSTFPRAKKILVAGSSAGGVGAVSFAPFLARFAYGNRVDLSVFNDAGPVAINLLDVVGIQARAADWQFGQFYPASCTDCDDQGQGTAIIKWRLDNDSTIREAFYSTDGDSTNRFFLKVPTQAMYRQLILSEHGQLNAAHPFRYKRFVRSGDDSHTALQTDLFYLGEVNRVRLYRWTTAFLWLPLPFFWNDLVEDFIPLP
jgi:hypothetical protein